MDIQSCSPISLLTTVDLTDGMNRRFVTKSIPCTSSPNGLVFSWKVALYQNEFVYSTVASDWNESNWQDHWMQGFYALPELKLLEETKEVTLYSLMSDSNWRFDISLDANNATIKREMIKPLQCTCGFHNLLNPGLLGQYNDNFRNKKLATMMNVVCKKYQQQEIQGHALVLGDDSFVGTQLYSILQQACLKKQPLVYSFENKEVSLLLWKRVLDYCCCLFHVDY